MEIYFIKDYDKHKKGSTIEIDIDSARKLFRAGVAVPVGHPLAKPNRSEPETASLEPKAETADMPRPKPKRGRPKKSE